MNIWKKTFTVLLTLVLVVSTMFPAISFAQTSPWYAPTLQDFTSKVRTAPESEIYGERYTQAQVYWIIYSLVNFAIGESVMGCTENAATALPCLEGIFQQGTGLPGVKADVGIILPLASLVDEAVKFRPASGIAYTAQKLDKLNIVDTSYAQDGGFGYNTLTEVSPLWVAVRNASYAMMVLVIVVLAFMVMFRSKISPQASLSVQIAIPRIVIALVLITFSYAIAGFLIDLTYLSLGVIGAIFGAGGISSLGAGEMFQALQSWGNGMLSMGILLILILLLPTVLASLGIGAATGGLSLGIAFVGIIIMLILVLIVYLIAVIKILWLMFKSMLTITLMVVFSPIYILWGVISPSSGFSSWIKSYVGHLSVFVTVPLFILFSHIIMWGSVGVNIPANFLNTYGINSTLLTGGVELPGFYGGFNIVFGVIGGLILLLSASKLAGSVRDMIITGRAQFGADLTSIGATAGIVGFGTEGFIDQRIASADARAKFAKGPKAVARITEEKQRWERLQGGIQGVGRRFGR